MTTMRHRFDKDNKEKEETPEERAARVERLLDASADWEPERSAPDDLVARAAARIERERSASWWSRLRYSQPWWGIGTLGLTAAAAMAFVIARLNSGPDPAVLYLTRSSDAPLMQVHHTALPDEEQGPRYQTVAYMSEGFTRPVMSRPTVSPFGDTTDTALPARYTVAFTMGETHALKKPVVSARKPTFVATNRSSKKSKSPFRHQHIVPTTSTGPKGKEVDEMALPPVWQEETVTRQDYRVAVPVILNPNDPTGNNPGGIPAVMEMTFEPPTVPLRSTFEEPLP